MYQYAVSLISLIPESLHAVIGDDICQTVNYEWTTKAFPSGSSPKENVLLILCISMLSHWYLEYLKVCGNCGKCGNWRCASLTWYMSNCQLWMSNWRISIRLYVKNKWMNTQRTLLIKVLFGSYYLRIYDATKVAIRKYTCLVWLHTRVIKEERLSFSMYRTKWI